MIFFICMPSCVGNQYKFISLPFLHEKKCYYVAASKTLEDQLMDVPIIELNKDHCYMNFLQNNKEKHVFLIPIIIMMENIQQISKQMKRKYKTKYNIKHKKSRERLISIGEQV